ncbi:hypothetical protein RchiOBHm_Chr2g0098491 [Rosa chinensis]|uniref:Uncharacterized protein n=1 Tax=Rosa chinensis TaxID=74649 RepID=A0A2P6RLM3_ROSCH|nr:hypothetical protein RchiOBHm_Chr2g0098491 [Rosa chinensis]
MTELECMIVRIVLLQARLIEVGRTWSRGIANSIASAYSFYFCVLYYLME